MNEALFYTKLAERKVKCELCPHNCILSKGQSGLCRARKNIEGILNTLNYGKTISLSIDPIEKKPLYHFFPGENILSIGPNSCNFACDFCQNYQSSQYSVPTKDITPGKLVELCRSHLSSYVAFTYTEPTTWFEFVLDSAKLLQQNGIKTVLVTNGYINPKPLQMLLPYIDAMNIDLKAYDNKFYRTICKGSLEPVLATIKTASKECHVEITNLLVTGENDSEKQINDLVNFVAEVDPQLPLHFSRYYPTFKMKNQPTPISKLNFAKKIAENKLKYVYLGNILTDINTICPNCGHVVIQRDYPLKIDIVKGNCNSCGHIIYGQFE
ncbi:MAG: AmmeMemoRadiSam system radical SAM enzyme [Candidatus Cloacimonetes bacterium]|nr:AmmeMemoRadiSam system radical SAM enzyme [Candidatus Cloacimonadota bacterium]